MKELVILLIGIGLGIFITQAAIKDVGVNLPHPVQPEIRINCTETPCDTIYNYKFLK